LLKYYIVTAILFFIGIRKAQPSLCKGGDTMSMLEDIKNAEQKADDLKKQATLEARNIVRDAQAEAHKEAEALIAEARKQAAAAIAQAEAQAQQEAAAVPGSGTGNPEPAYGTGGSPGQTGSRRSGGGKPETG
jgi:vacuolar-type H+-ATPase subunit H